MQRRAVSQLSKWEWLFLVVSFVNIAACVGLSIERLIDVVLNESDSPDFIFCILLIANSSKCASCFCPSVVHLLYNSFAAYVNALCSIFINCIELQLKAVN